ncbi:hypothetical protein BMS3Bbin15_00444 [archaeon BMS3Bbin15]|nr:hypothetical protein BMS3Bbin15_00444 [archaeon BMS3Bbin15]
MTYIEFATTIESFEEVTCRLSIFPGFGDIVTALSIMNRGIIARIASIVNINPLFIVRQSLPIPVLLDRQAS